MNRRLELHKMLKEVTGLDTLYYQKPENIKLQFPCLIYKRINEDADYANNKIYRDASQWELILIDRAPDSDYIDKLKTIEYCRFSREYVSDNLYHSVYTIYY